MKKTKKAGTAKRANRQIVYFTALREPSDKLSPQAAAIVTVLHKAGKRLSRQELIAKLDSATLKSEQPASRVLSYYKKELISSRHIKVEKEKLEKPAKATPAPAPAPTPAAPTAPTAPVPVAAAPVVAPAAAPSAPAAT